MSVSLERTDFQRLVNIVARSPNFNTVQGRVDTVVYALRGEPRGDDVLIQLNLDGNPHGVAIQVVDRLARFGRVTPDKEALGIFINTLLDYHIGDDADIEFMRILIEKYNMDRPVVVGPPIDEWKGTSNLASVQEKIIGENTLRDIRILQLALNASKAVVHITLPMGYGSGFLAGEGLLMTNNHVIDRPEVASDSLFSFNYQLGLDRLPEKAQIVRAKEGGLFYTNKELDYTVVEIIIPSDSVQPLALKAERVQKHSRVNIIQHPGGHFKQISMQNNFVEYADRKVVQYITATLAGSSGSCVTNDEFEVVAIHHSGGMLVEPDTQRRYLRNGGTSMIAVLDDLRANKADIYQRLNHVER